jgi:hypothetical protein
LRGPIISSKMQRKTFLLGSARTSRRPGFVPARRAEFPHTPLPRALASVANFLAELF